jgi:hypothetical protein
MLLAFVFALTLASSEEGAPGLVPGDAQPGAWSFAAVPRFTLSSDDGIGLGVRGSAFWNRFHASPYKTAIHFQAFATSNLVQHHYVRVDAIDAFNVPLRLEAEAAFYASISANFCGLGDAVAVPVCAAGDLSRHRWWSPSLSAVGRWRFINAPKLEGVLGYRGALIVPGAITFDGVTDGPYPGSVLAQRNPAGDPGFSSTVLAGVSVDTRDFEPSPRSGIFASVIARGAHSIVGSSWDWAGVTGAFAVYAPLNDATEAKEGRVPLVAAQRVVIDVIGGDPPVLELMRMGGLHDGFAFGGESIGRGLRVSRLAGEVKVMSQHELRAELLSFDVFGNDLVVGSALFMDVGAVMASVDAPPRFPVGHPLEGEARLPMPAWGAGLALRVSWNRAFIIRNDLGFSPLESERVGFYTAPGHPF